jgi:hypothetical protein
MLNAILVTLPTRISWWTTLQPTLPAHVLPDGMVLSLQKEWTLPENYAGWELS